MSKELPYQEMVSCLPRIQKGDVIYLISDVVGLIRQTARQKGSFDPNVFLESLMEKIGTEGTLLIPTFNWDFCKGIPFDYWKTPCRTGLLGTTALHRKDFVRTKHPIYSFAVWGRDQKFLYEQDEPNSFGKNSLFDYLWKKEAKALVVGLEPMDGFTFMHHVEQMVGVSFRYHKTFTADYTDRDGVTARKSYTMYVRNLELEVEEHSEHFNQMLKALNIADTHRFGRVDMHTVLLRPAFDLEAMDIVFNDCRNLYSYLGQTPKKEERE